jgi:hypothetical protein
MTHTRFDVILERMRRDIPVGGYDSQSSLSSIFQNWFAEFRDRQKSQSTIPYLSSCSADFVGSVARSLQILVGDGKKNGALFTERHLCSG